MKSQRYCGTIQGKAPTDHSTMETVNIPSPLPALNGNQVCTLYQYLQFNGGQSIIPTKEDGDCLYGAFRRGTDLPVEVVMKLITAEEVSVKLERLRVIADYQQVLMMANGPCQSLRRPPIVHEESEVLWDHTG